MARQPPAKEDRSVRLLKVGERVRHVLSELPRNRLIATATLSVAIAATGWLSFPYDTWLAGVLFLAWCGVALALIVWAARLAWRSRAAGARGLVPVLLVLTALAGCCSAMAWGFAALDWAAEKRSFSQHRGQYDRIVRSMMTQRLEPGSYTIREPNMHYSVEVSDVARIQLRTHGYFSNWKNIYYDPSDRYADFQERERAHHFGGTVFGCRRLGGHYFLCQYDLEVF